MTDPLPDVLEIKAEELHHAMVGCDQSSSVMLGARHQAHHVFFVDLGGDLL